MYIHERKEWPEFYWKEPRIAPLLAEARHLQGRLLGRMESLGFDLRNEATLQTLTHDVTKTSEIEGEKLDAEQVRSSLAKKLGINIGAHKQIDRSRDVNDLVKRNVMIRHDAGGRSTNYELNPNMRKT